jgi:hypothetical protein
MASAKSVPVLVGGPFRKRASGAKPLVQEPHCTTCGSTRFCVWMLTGQLPPRPDEREQDIRRWVGAWLCADCRQGRLF